MTYTAAELAALRDTQAAFMFDACQVGTVTDTQDAIGDEVAGVPSYGTEVACGIEMLSGGSRTEWRSGALTIVSADARLRLPHGTAVTVTSVVKVTKRQGVAITPIVYEVTGEPAIGATGIVCYLRKVTT